MSLGVVHKDSYKKLMGKSRENVCLEIRDGSWITRGWILGRQVV